MRDSSSCSTEEVLRFVQIGLLCGQENAIDRPDMSMVVFLLSNEKSRIPEPKQPSFCKRSSIRKRRTQSSTSEYLSHCSTQNVVTTTFDELR